MKAQFFITDMHTGVAGVGDPCWSWRLIIPPGGSGVLVPLHGWHTKEDARTDANIVLKALGFEEIVEVPEP